MNDEMKVITQSIEDNAMNEAAGGAGHSRWITYVVMRGDTLGKIANRYGVTVADLCQWNVIEDPDWLVAGQRLSIHSRR